MQRVQQILKSTLTLNHSFWLHFVILLLLWALAFWYLALVVIEYRFDNHDTHVQLVRIRDEFPFLDDAHICIDYGDATIFSGIWSGELSREDLLARRADYESSIEGFATFNLTLEDGSRAFDALSLENKMDAAIIFEQIQHLDRDIARCALGNSTCPHWQGRERLDAIYGNAQLEALRNVVWESLKPNLVRNAGSDSDNVSLTYFSTDKICFSIPLPEKLLPETSSVVYALGMITDKVISALAVNASTIPSIDIDLPGYRISVNEHESATTPNKLIRIRNMGVYDRGHTLKHCITDKLITADKVLIDSSDESDCKFEQYLELITHRCECLPLSYRHLVSSLEHSHLPHCSVTKYKECIESLKAAASTEGDCTEPCTVWKNDYQLLDDHGPTCRRVQNHEICSSTFLTFACDDRYYTLYEEKYRITGPHLLAEIAAVLCFFTGFSVLGLWQLISCTCAVYQRRKRAEEEKHLAVVPSWPSILVTYMEKGSLEITAHHEARKASDRLVRDVELSVQGLQNELSAMTVNIGALETEIWHMKQNNRKSTAPLRFEGNIRNTRRLQRKVWRNLDHETPVASK